MFTRNKEETFSVCICCSNKPRAVYHYHYCYVPFQVAERRHRGWPTTSTYGWNKLISPKVFGMGRSCSSPPAHPLLLPGCWRRVSLGESITLSAETPHRRRTDSSSLGLSWNLALSRKIRRWEGLSGEPLSSLLHQAGLTSRAGCWHVSAHPVVHSPRAPGLRGARISSLGGVLLSSGLSKGGCKFCREHTLMQRPHPIARSHHVCFPATGQASFLGLR